MNVTSLTIAEDKSKITLVITDAQDLTSILLWDKNTYKNFTTAIDLSSLLTGATTENITILPKDLGISYFDGIYFVEVSDDEQISFDFVAELVKYKECIIDKITTLSMCDSCLENDNNSLRNAHMLLSSLEDAIEERFIDDMINQITMLDKFCDNECRTCKSVSTLIKGDTNDNFNPDTVSIIVDGGSID